MAEQANRHTVSGVLSFSCLGGYTAVSTDLPVSGLFPVPSILHIALRPPFLKHLLKTVGDSQNL